MEPDLDCLYYKMGQLMTDDWVVPEPLSNRARTIIKLF